MVVVGSGTMGSGIAAQLCNANIPVTLLDLKTEISERAKKRIFESRPPLLIDKSKINNMEVQFLKFPEENQELPEGLLCSCACFQPAHLKFDQFHLH